MTEAPVEYSWRRWRPHPILPALSEQQVLKLAATASGRERLVTLYKKREDLIKKSETPGQLLDYAFELECWIDADKDLAAAQTDGRDYGGLYVGGGKRSAKSTWGARSLLRSALTYSGGIIWVFQRTLPISRITVQRILWEWMPDWLRKLNDVSGKRKNDDPTKVRYTVDGGFAGDNVVLPNSTHLMFLSYEMEPKNYQGAEIGARVSGSGERPELPWVKEWRSDGVAIDRRGNPIPNIGAWLDEDAPLAWVETARNRLTTRNAKFIWTFTTENGITLAVKALVGSGTNTETRQVDETLPADRVLVPGCPKGHVPYRAQTVTPGLQAIYFHTRFNPFGTNYTNLKAQYRGRDSKQILANLFGYSEDMFQRAWPLFGGYNQVERWQVPALGTNYLLGDPAGSRNFTWIWVRVCPGMGAEDWYIIDEWPDWQTFGEWALPDDSQNPNPDGVAGPAQRSLGWGVEQYKQMIHGRERIALPEPELFAELDKFEVGSQAWLNIVRRFRLDDLQRLRLAREAIEDGAEPGSTIELPVRDRLLDPRAGGTPQVAERKGKTLIDKFREAQTDAKGAMTGPAMRFRPAPGLDIQVGIEAVNQLLYFDKEQDMIPGLNYPRLFVVRSCRQIIWTLDNYSALGGEHGGCKDFADLLRYAATSRFRYITPGACKTHGGGSY